MFCSNCGKQIEDGSSFCLFCGSAQDIQQQNPQQQYTQQQYTQQQYTQQQNPQQQYTQQQYTQQQDTQQASQQQYYQQPGGQPNQQYQQANQQYQQPQSGGNNDPGVFLWAIPGLLIPLVGLVIFFIIRNNKPASAKMALIGAGVGFVFYLALRFL